MQGTGVNSARFVGPWIGLRVLAAIVLAAAASCVALAFAQSAHAETCTKQWTGATSTAWSTSTNWMPSGAPGAGAYACINDSVSVSHEPTITAATSIAGLSIEGHTLTVNSTLTLTGAGDTSAVKGSSTVKGTGAINVNGVLDFVSGTLSNTGLVTINGTVNWVGGVWSGSGAVTVAAAGTLNIEPSSTSPALDRNLNNLGTAKVTETAGGGAFQIGSCSARTFTNTGTFTYVGPDTDDPGIVSCGTGAFVNNGSFIKAAGLDRTDLQVPFNQGMAGTTTANAGALAFRAGSSTAVNGTFTGSGGQIRFSSGTYVLNSVAFNGGVYVNGATINVASGKTLTFNSANTFASGVIGGAGGVSVVGTLSWTGGSMLGPGSASVAVGGTINAAPGGLTAILDRNLTNNGTFHLKEVAAGNQFIIGNCTTTTFTNAASFIYVGPSHSDPGVSSCNGTFSNNGSFTKTSGGALTSFTPFFNQGVSGTTTVQAGVVSLLGGSSTSDNGTFAGAGGVLRFGSGSFLFNSAAFTGGVDVSGADLEINAAKTITMTGTNSFTSGTIGTGGIGAGNLVINGTLKWVSGTWEGSGATTVGVGAALNIAPTTTSGAATLDRKLTNNGTINLNQVASGGSFGIGTATCSGITLTNAGAFNYAGPSSSDPGIGGCASTFTNTGTFTKSSGAASTAFGSLFNNPGTIAVNAGTLVLNGGLSQFPTSPGTLTGGTYNLIGGSLQVPSLDVTSSKATIVLSGTTAKLNDTSNVNGLRNLASNTSVGTLRVLNGKALTVKNLTNAGTVEVDGAGSVLTTAGTYTQSAGTTTVSTGATLQTSGSTSQIKINAGLVVGGGTLKASSTTNPLVQIAGEIRPGEGVGIVIDTLTITGKYAQTSTGVYSAEVSGVGSNDMVNASGAATLDGTLNITTDGAYAPTVGDTFTILSGSSVSGTFATVNGLNFTPGFAFQVVYNATNVQLVVVAA